MFLVDVAKMSVKIGLMIGVTATVVSPVVKVNLLILCWP